MPSNLQAALQVSDKNSDGRISREELASFLYTDTTTPKAKRKSPKSKKKTPSSKRKNKARHGLRDLVEKYDNEQDNESDNEPQPD